jgi:hypothetical protein
MIETQNPYSNAANRLMQGIGQQGSLQGLYAQQAGMQNAASMLNQQMCAGVQQNAYSLHNALQQQMCANSLQSAWPYASAPDLRARRFAEAKSNARAARSTAIDRALDATLAAMLAIAVVWLAIAFVSHLT